MSTRLDFMYFSEPDMLKAGVTDMHRCIEVMVEMFSLMGQGDYLMGGKTMNSHGIQIFFPEESPFPNMPLYGADRRFMAMPAYLGGRFNMAGIKWYGSNIANVKRGLPRSVLMLTLNDVETGAPLAHMSANLISAMRTGAIPGVGAKYLANADSKIISAIGVGVIGRTCFTAIKDSLPNLKKVQIYDLMPEAAHSFADYVRRTFPDMEAIIADSIENAVHDADVVNVATSGSVEPFIDDKWLKDGVLLTLPSFIRFPNDFLANTKKVLDNKKMHIGWEEEMENVPGGLLENIGLVSGYMMQSINRGEMSWDDVLDIGDVINGTIKARESAQEKIIFCIGGMPTEDVAWGTELFRKACDMELGIKLNIWEEQYKL